MASRTRKRYDAPPDYLRIDDAMYRFQVSEETIIKFSKICGAWRKRGKVVLINYEILKDYIETTFLED
ncbi:MAG: hypothetical protein K6G84_09195 [Lachnospiraceae bacterium]|nr:hypothetical protein [Lachnospiraceae bacterium]